MTAALALRVRQASFWWHEALQSDFVYRLRRSPLALTSAVVMTLCIGAAVLAPLIAPHTPFDVATISLIDSFLPPAWIEGGTWRFPLGTDDQGRCLLSTILYGGRVSLLVGFASIGLAMTVGLAVGLLCGWFGGRLDALLMRIADLQMALPSFMLALLISGIARAALPRDVHAELALWIIVLAIAAADWPQFARIVRASTLAVRGREYVQAAQLIGVKPRRILMAHILPNVITPVLVVATVGLAFAILSEASLSFVGVGMPPTQPTLGMLIRIGNSYLFSGEWWISVIPSFVLLILVLSVNLFGDWLRDVLNPRMK